MAKIVTIDASAAASWLFASQRTDKSDSFLIDSAERRFSAPAILAREIGNLIGVRARGDAAQIAAMLSQLTALEIEIAEPFAAADVFGLLESARAAGLSLFDAAYLTHAEDNGAALASRDSALIEAARAAGVDVIDLRD